MKGFTPAQRYTGGSVGDAIRILCELQGLIPIIRPPPASEISIGRRVSPGAAGTS